MAQPLNLTSSEYRSLAETTERVKDMSVVSALEVFADLKVVNNEITALSERRKLAPIGRGERRGIPVPANVWSKLLEISNYYSETGGTINFHLAVLLFEMPIALPGLMNVNTPPVYLIPKEKVTGFTPKTVNKGETIPVLMDSLAPSKNVKVELLKPDNTLVELVETTSDLAGVAIASSTVPAGYSENKIKLRISQTLVAEDLSVGQKGVKFEQEDTITVLG